MANQNVKTTEVVLLSSIGGSLTRSIIVSQDDAIALADNQEVTTDSPRDWQLDSVTTAEVRELITVRIDLATADTAGGVASWQNPEPVSILIERVMLDLQTVASGAGTVDIGTTTVSAATSSDNLMDGLDVNSAIGLFDNITDKGSNGKSRQKLASGKWITASKASGSAAGLAGFLHITYRKA